MVPWVWGTSNIRLRRNQFYLRQKYDRVIHSRDCVWLISPLAKVWQSLAQSKTMLENISGETGNNTYKLHSQRLCINSADGRKSINIRSSIEINFRQRRKTLQVSAKGRFSFAPKAQNITKYRPMADFNQDRRSWNLIHNGPRADQSTFSRSKMYKVSAFGRFFSKKVHFFRIWYHIFRLFFRTEWSKL